MEPMGWPGAFCRCDRGGVIRLDKIAIGANDLVEIENCRLCERLSAVETIWSDRRQTITSYNSGCYKAKNREKSKSKCAESRIEGPQVYAFFILSL